MAVFLGLTLFTFQTKIDFSFLVRERGERPAAIHNVFVFCLVLYFVCVCVCVTYIPCIVRTYISPQTELEGAFKH